MTTEIENYINALEPTRKLAFEKLRNCILKNIPQGFAEEISYGMVGYVVPKSIYPSGYHCNTKLPLPFGGIAAQKNSINIHHMGIYANKQLFDWFVTEFPNHTKTKLDMGKSCIRFKKIDEIPTELIGQLFSKLSTKQWIDMYESNFIKKL